MVDEKDEWLRPGGVTQVAVTETADKLQKNDRSDEVGMLRNI